MLKKILTTLALLSASQIASAAWNCQSFNSQVYCTGTAAQFSTNAPGGIATRATGNNTDGTVHNYSWSGTAWVDLGESSGAGSSSSSPAYVTPVDTGGTSMAVDRSSTPDADVPGFMPWALRDDALTTLAEADGETTPLRVDSTGKLWTSSVNYVTENDSTLATSSNIPTTACTTGGSCTTLVNGYDLGAIAASRCLLTIAAGSDAGNFDAAKVYLCNGATSPGTGATGCANVLGGSTGVTSAHYTAPAVGSPLQWAVSYTRSSGVVDDGNLVDLGSGQTWQGMLNIAGANSLYVEVSSDAATLDATPYITCN